VTVVVLIVLWVGLTFDRHSSDCGINLKWTPEIGPDVKV
jgi:hypothetical protein